MSDSVSPRGLVDAHVHLPEGQALPVMLDAAARNFKTSAEECGGVSNYVGVLMLAERSGAQVFEAMREARLQTLGGWRAAMTDEAESLMLAHEDGARLVVVAGRQVVTVERLEVLALATSQVFSDGLPMTQTLLDVKRSGALPVLPWGLGKWWLRRGRILDDVLASNMAAGVALGDNKGRPRSLPTPPRIREAWSHRRQVLPGSDPFPLPGQERRVGRFGFVTPKALDMRTPARSLLKQIGGASTPLPVFGCTDTFWNVLSDGLRLRMCKRKGATPSEGGIAQAFEDAGA